MQRVALFLAAILATPVLAQESAGTSANSAVGSTQSIYAIAKGYLTRAAEQMPEADYSFKPTPDVRSFGEIIGHLANAQYMFCSAALGEQNPSAEDNEKRMTKAALTEALGASFVYCDRAFAQSDTDALKTIKLFGRDRSRLSTLVLNTAHDFEHYGNLVTYMRMKGMVPPSSQPSQ